MCPISVRCGIGFIPFDIAVKRAVYSVKAKRMVEPLANGERALIGLSLSHRQCSYNLVQKYKIVTLRCSTDRTTNYCKIFIC